nr:glycoside hydrolase family 88 protein [uncultured Friedmanniella sp.]
MSEGARGLDPVGERVLTALLAMQRRSWEQGVASHALLDLERHDVVAVLARDAVTQQSSAGNLADLDESGAVNSGAVGEAVLWQAQRTGEERLQQAFDAQLRWFSTGAPRADDGTLFHLTDTPECWVDSIYMIVPVLVLAGRVDEAARQLDGHRRRLFDPATGLWGWRWHEAEGRRTHPAPWGTGNGWVVAGLARALRLLGPDPAGPARAFAADAARHAHTVIDACLAHRRPDGTFGNVLDDPASFEENNLAQMLAFATLTGSADGWLPASYAEVGRSLLDHARTKVDAHGFVTPVCGAPRFDRPGTSVEAQAFFLLATAAARRHEGPG